MPTIGERFKRSWNAFMGRDPTSSRTYSAYNYAYGMRPDRFSLHGTNAKTIVASIYNRIAVDCAQIDIRHVRLDSMFGNYKETINSSLNECLSLNANMDQTGKALIQDAVMSMFDEGCVAILPTDTTTTPTVSDSYQIDKIRVGRIVQWYPDSVRIEAYNELTGKKQEIVMLKKNVCIVENPFYATMNSPNSILQRLKRLLVQIDRTNEQNSSDKIDLIIQLPYQTKSQVRQEQAAKRLRDIESQLMGSKYGIAYIDATERVTQLNRSIENNLWSQATDLTNQLYNQLGLTEAIFNGKANEQEMLNYYNRTIEPILTAITLEMERKWLSRTARTQLQAIRFFRDPFKLVPVNDLAEVADKFTRNEIMTSNEFRAVIGMKPSKSKNADQLVNSNNVTYGTQTRRQEEEPPEEMETDNQLQDE